MILGPQKNQVVLRHGHMACGIGAGAQGFNLANPRVGNLVGKFECAGGIDVDAGAIANFEKLTGVPGTVLDLFDRQQYIDFHGKPPPHGWTEACPADIRRIFGRLDVLFASYPCKGFSGLLSQLQSTTIKYQALNALTLRGMWLSLEAYRDDPIPIILFENVPRIASRGRWLLDQIVALLHAYGYHVAETVHDCGEIGGLAQSRKRFLLVARHPDKVPDFMYEPIKHPLRGVGEILGKLPLPGDLEGGPMHRVPELQWRTWVRLAFVEAGKDWRSLNRLEVQDGMLKDYGIVRQGLRENAYGVCRWDEKAPLITGARSPGQGKFSVADVRPFDPMYRTSLGVIRWTGEAGTIGGRGFPLNGAYSVADPRPGYGPNTHQNILYVVRFEGSAKSVIGTSHVAGGAMAVSDPRVDGHPRSVQLGVKRWSQTAGVVKGDMSVGGGPYAIADIRLPEKRFNNVFRIVPFESPAPAVHGPGGPGGQAVADPRMPETSYVKRKYKVHAFVHSSRAVIGASTTGDGAFAVADPRCTWGAASHRNKLKVTVWFGPAGTDRVGSGAACVADPRPDGLRNPARAKHSYDSQAHYGVCGWGDTSIAVPGFAKYDRGRWSVADGRLIFPTSDEGEEAIGLPALDKRLVARIIALDGTWHRPFTTLELAGLQSLFDPEEVFEMDERIGRYIARYEFNLASSSDASKREWIGNAVPSLAAKGMGETIGEALLRARLGVTFSLSALTIWVSPLDVALAVNTQQPAWQMDAGLI